MQPVIVRTGTQVCKTFPDGRILHTGNPEPFHRFGTARQAVDRAEDQFTLAPGVAGIDHLGHIFPPQQGTQHIKLVPLILGDGEPPGLRQDGQIIITPLGVVGIVGGRICQPSQVSQAPAHPPTVPLQVAVFAGGGPDYGGQTLGNGRFLSDHQLHGFSSSFLVAMRSAAGGRFPRRVAHSDNSHSHNRGGRETKKEDGKFPSHPPACVSSCVQRGCW